MEVITKIIKDTNPKKAIGSDKIPPKIIKLLANIIIKILIITVFAKIASVRPIFKKKERKKA